MSLHAGGSSRTKRTAFMESQEGNVLFDANSNSAYSHIIQIDDEPVIIRGHHMESGDSVLVEIVDGNGGGEHFSPYLRKGNQVKLTHKCNVIVLSIPGRYRFQLIGSLGTVFVNSYKASMTHEFLKEALESSCCTTCDDEVWIDTGLTRCVGEVLEKQQESQTGLKRWVADGAVEWTDTGNVRCEGDVVEKQQVNQCGHTKWIEKEPVAWLETGEERCKNNLVEVKEVNQCGQFRWTVTNTTCGFDASYPLPGKGYMYQPGDVVDPEATVEMTECDGKVMGWLYPKPKPGATTAVKGCDGELLGYAANRSDTAPLCNPDCDEQSQSIDVTVYPQVNVEVITNGESSVSDASCDCPDINFVDAFDKEV